VADEKRAPVFDYSEFEEVPGEGEFEKLNALVLQMREAEREVAQRTTELKFAQEKVRNLQEVLLPTFMDRLGLEEAVTSSGLKVKIKTSIHASLPVRERERYERGLEWLRQNGQEGIIKHQLEVPLGKGQNDLARELIQQLRKEHGLAAHDEVWVEPPTLGKLVRERIEEGKAIPEDLFGVTRLRKAEVDESRKD